MANSKYIKVTPKGETKPVIVQATLKTFYISQGAKIENITDEEVYQIEPALRPAAPAPSQLASIAEEMAKSLQAVAELKKENMQLKKDIEFIKDRNGELENTIKTLRGVVNEKDELIAELREKISTKERKPKAAE